MRPQHNYLLSLERRYLVQPQEGSAADFSDIPLYNVVHDIFAQSATQVSATALYIGLCEQIAEIVCLPALLEAVLLTHQHFDLSLSVAAAFAMS